MKEFTPTQGMKSAASAVFLAMAMTETIRPIVEGYQKEIIDFYEWEIAPEWQEKRKGRGIALENNIVTETKHAYLLNADDLQLYLKECGAAQEKAGLKTESPDHCPLLVAEDIQRVAERVLMDNMKPITGIDAADVWNPEHRKEYINLSLKLLAPFVDVKF